MKQDINRFRELLAERSHPLCRMDEHVTFTCLSQGQALYRHWTAPEGWHLLISGIAVQSVFHPEGRRQIVDLLFPGDFCCGLSADNEAEEIHAIADETVVANYPLNRIERAADSDTNLVREICAIAFASLARRQAQLLVLGHITALDKLYAFLVDMHLRIPSGPNDSLKLPLSRYDIADYLGVSVETVSRCFSDLKDRHLIAMTGTRTIKIINRHALSRSHNECPEARFKSERSQSAPAP